MGQLLHWHPRGWTGASARPRGRSIDFFVGCLLGSSAIMVEHKQAPGDILTLLRKGANSEDELCALLDDDPMGDPTEGSAEYIARLRDLDGWTPLHWASQDGLKKLLAKLLGLGATPNSADQCGATPLMIAAYNGHVSIVEALLKERSTDVRQGNTFLSTAAHYAAQRGQAACIDALVKWNAEVDCVDKHGDSPLAWAARNGHIEAVRKLVELRADPLNDNNASEDPIELAHGGGHDAVAAVMEDSVGDPELLAMSV